MKIEIKKIEEIKENPENPRVISPKDERKLGDSLKRFGFVEPVILNKHKGREDVCISGHQRIMVAKKMGITEVPVVYVDLDLEKENKLGIILNQHYGKWDYEKLGSFEQEFLVDVGFSGEEMKKIDEYSESKKIIEGEMEFTTELLEENNYVLFAFDNVLDWQMVADKLGLKATNSLDSKEGYSRKGIGRVLKGKILLDIIQKDGDSNS